jgi:hypothetical protein
MKATPTREWTLCLPRRGHLRLCHAEPASGRVPRLARLMALALRLEGLLHSGVVPHQAELARLGQVSRARISQILNLVNLAPDVQEQILFLPPLFQGRERLHLADAQALCRTFDWRRQRRLWQALLLRTSSIAGNYLERA